MKKSVLFVLGLTSALALASCKGATKITKDEFAEESLKRDPHTYQRATIKYSIETTSKVVDMETLYAEVAVAVGNGQKTTIKLKLKDGENNKQSGEEKCTFNTETNKWELDNPNGNSIVLSTLSLNMASSISMASKYEEDINTKDVSGYVNYYKDPFKVEIKIAEVTLQDGLKCSDVLKQSVQFDEYGFLTKGSVTLDTTYKVIDHAALVSSMGYTSLANFGVHVDLSAYSKMYYKEVTTYTISYK